MPNYDELSVRLTKEMDDVIKEVGELVEEVSKDYALLSADAQVNGPDGIIHLTSDIILSKVHLPWYVPEFIVRTAISMSIKKLLEKKNA